MKKSLTTCSILSLFIFSAVIAPTTAAPIASKPTVLTHPIEYHIGCGQAMIWDGSLEYFKAHGFSTVHLVVRDQKTYEDELAKIKSLGMKGIIDIEIPIWDGGRKKSVPIESFASYFQSLKAAGWEYVASEGGREGDVSYLMRYFKGYVNYNCDQCGLWKNMHVQSGTVENSWESFYPREWQYIQQGAKESAALGKKNGILAGVWGGSTNPIRQNSLTGGSPSYKEMLDWSYANGIGFTHFHVWCSINSNGLASYKQLGFEQIVTELQKTYPATTTASSAASASKVATPTPKATVTVKATPPPTATATVKATTTPKVTVTVKQAAPTAMATLKATATPQLAKTAPVATKAISTPILVTASKQASATTSASDVLENDSVLGMSVPAAQTNSIASLPPQPILEFSLLGIGVPAVIAGAIYMLMRRR
ncbi:MAG: hypothetical protein WBZ42_06520 [Halobacteriota archaeon]